MKMGADLIKATDSSVREMVNGITKEIIKGMEVGITASRKVNGGTRYTTFNLTFIFFIKHIKV